MVIYVGYFVTGSEAVHKSRFTDSQAFPEDISYLLDSKATNETDKKLAFERFLTYKKRMSRMAVIQTVYMIDIHLASINELPSQDSLFKTESAIRTDIFCHSTIYIYKHHLLTKQLYGNTYKNKKIDERFLVDLVGFVVQNMPKIDAGIEKHLNSGRSISSLDPLVRAVLRSAIGEKIMLDTLETAILTSEYTNLSSYFFNGKEIGFINGVIHSYCKANK